MRTLALAYRQVRSTPTRHGTAQLLISPDLEIGSTVVFSLDNLARPVALRPKARAGHTP